MSAKLNHNADISAWREAATAAETNGRNHDIEAMWTTSDVSGVDRLAKALDKRIEDFVMKFYTKDRHPVTLEKLDIE